MTSEFERLQTMYREMGDEHLQDLADDPDELTDEARMALAAEMRRRGLDHKPDPAPSDAPLAVAEPELQSGFGAAIPGVIPAGASAVEQALEPGGEIRQGMIRLVSFFDGHELSRACETLEDANLDFAVEEVTGDAMSGLAPHFEIWVPVGTDPEARALLRAKLGLFPLPEVDADTTEPDSTGGELVVAEFASHAEAESVRAMLHQHGFAAQVDSAVGDTEVSLVTVPAAEQERALTFLSSRMDLD